MTTAFARPFSIDDVMNAVERSTGATLDIADLTKICAGDLRDGMRIVEKVNGKRRYFTVWGHPLHRGHEVIVNVSVNGHRLNWRYEAESPVFIKE